MQYVKGGVGARSILPGATGGGLFTLSLEGLPQLDARLLKLGHDLTAGRLIEAGLRAAALPMQNEWKRLAPYKTGTYRRSINTELKDGSNGLEAIIGTDITEPPYPEFLEFGTSKMSPHPSMRPAFDATKGEAVEAFANALQAALASFGV